MSLTKIKSVDAHSPAQRAGVRPGETLTHINGRPIVDVLDYKFFAYDPRLELTLVGEDGRSRTLRVRKAEGEELGLNFETYLMDKARSCANRCIFCFVDQMPPGMRETLYFKDDDARLSFLMGNYITLTNLSEREIARIAELRISPINISVHATDPALREAMLKHRRDLRPGLQRQQAGLPGPVRGQDRRGQGHQGRRRHRRPDRRYHHLPRRLRGRHQRHRRRREHGLRRVIEYERDETI